MLAHGLQRWHNIKPALDHRFVWAVPWRDILAVFSRIVYNASPANEMKRMGLYATIVHIWDKLGQERLLRMVRWMRWHCPPDKGFEIRALAVWSRARYVSVTEALGVSGEETFCFFETWRPEWGSNPRSPTFQAANLPSKHKTFVQHLYNVYPTSSTLVQHCTNIIQMFCVYASCGVVIPPSRDPGLSTEDSCLDPGSPAHIMWVIIWGAREPILEDVIASLSLNGSHSSQVVRSSIISHTRWRPRHRWAEYDTEMCRVPLKVWVFSSLIQLGNLLSILPCKAKRQYLLGPTLQVSRYCGLALQGSIACWIRFSHVTDIRSMMFCILTKNINSNNIIIIFFFIIFILNVVVSNYCGIMYAMRTFPHEVIFTYRSRS